MVGTNGAAASMLHLRDDAVAHTDFAFTYFAHMCIGCTQLLGIDDGEFCVSAAEQARIAHLTAAFSIKRRSIQHYLTRLTCQQAINLLCITNQGHYLALVLFRFITAELSLAIEFDCSAQVDTELAGSTRAFA